MAMVIVTMLKTGLPDMGIILGGWRGFVNGLQIFLQFPGLARMPKLA